MCTASKDMNPPLQVRYYQLIVKVTKTLFCIDKDRTITKKC